MDFLCCATRTILSLPGGRQYQCSIDQEEQRLLTEDVRNKETCFNSLILLCLEIDMSTSENQLFFMWISVKMGNPSLWTTFWQIKNTFCTSSGLMSLVTRGRMLDDIQVVPLLRDLQFWTSWVTVTHHHPCSVPYHWPPPLFNLILCWLTDCLCWPLTVILLTSSVWPCPLPTSC